MRAKMEKGPSDAIAGSRPRVATATVLKTTPEQTFQFVSYHRHLGVDEIILFFDDPTDVAADALDGVEGVTVFRCDAAHWSEVGPKGESPRGFHPDKQLMQIGYCELGRRILTGSSSSTVTNWCTHLTGCTSR